MKDNVLCKTRISTEYVHTKERLDEPCAPVEDDVIHRTDKRDLFSIH